MAKRSDNKKGSPVHRRTFPGVQLDAALERELQQAKALGYAMEWKGDGSGLALSRSWIEGTDYRQIFRECTPQDRILYSQELFIHALERLGDLRHGALHPGNVLHVTGSPAFLDPVANAALLGGGGGPTYAVWLWAPRILAGWEVRDWDRVNLLRMAALLAQGPASWDTAPGLGEAIELCRHWAREFIRELPTGDDRTVSLSSVLDLLERLEEKPEIDDFARVAQLLENMLSRQGAGRILRPSDEDEIRFRVREIAADPSDELLAVELLRRGIQRQSDLRCQAEALLAAGVYPGTRYVRRAARRNAERLYCSYQVVEAEAISEVQSLIGELNLIDEMEARKAWSVLVDEYVKKHCKLGYTSRDLRKMMAVVAGIYQLPSRVAEAQLRQYLEQQKKLSLRSGFFGIR